jgi:hypothetical protein
MSEEGEVELRFMLMQEQHPRTMQRRGGGGGLGIGDEHGGWEARHSQKLQVQKRGPGFKSCQILRNFGGDDLKQCYLCGMYNPKP